MDVSASLCQRFVHSRPCLIDVTHKRQGTGKECELPNVRINGQSFDDTMRWIGKAALQERAGGDELAKPEVVNPLQAAPMQLRHSVVPHRADLFELFS